MDHINTYSALTEEPPLVSPWHIRGTRVRRSFAFSTRLSWLILGLIAALYVGVCFTPVIFDDNEGLYAGAVREMHQRGDWLVPTNNGFPRVQKPPLVYWTMLLSVAIFGENEFALRLPNALASVGWIIATYLIMRRLGGERFGIASAMVLASMLGVWVFTHLIQPEPFLACFISLALWCLVEARLFASPESGSLEGRFSFWRFSGDHWYTLFWIFLGLGTMSKGLHGALWPLGVVILTALFAPGWRPWLRPILSLRGILAFSIIVIPWYAYMASRFPGFLSAHFINEQLGATLNTRYPPDAKQIPLWQFYVQHLLFWLPWTMLLPGAVYASIKAVRTARQYEHAFAPQILDIFKLLGCWVVLTMVSVAFSTRQDYYSMSSWGVVAAFLTVPWMAPYFSFLRMPRWYLFVPCLLVAIVGLISLGFVDWIEPQLNALGATTAAPIRERDNFFDAIVGISPALWGHFVTLLGIFGFAMLIAGASASVMVWRYRSFPALLILSGSMAVPVCLAAVGFTMMSPYFSLAEEAGAINREMAAAPDAFVACEALPHTASSLFYYLNARIHWVNAPFNNQYAQQVLGQGRDYYWNEARLKEVWQSSHPVYFILEESRLAHWQTLLPPGARVVNRSGTRLVLSNR